MTRGSGPNLQLLLTAIVAMLCSASRAWAYDAQLTWSSVDGAAAYRIYMRQAGGQFGTGTDVGKPTPDGNGQIQFVVSNLPLDITSIFAVTAMQDTGAESPLSNELSVFMAATATPTVTASRTATASDTFTPVPSATSTATRTLTYTAVPSATNTATRTATSTETFTPTYTRTPTASSTATYTWTPTATATNTLPPTATRTASPSATASATLTSTPQSTATSTRTATPIPTNTATATAVPPTATATASASPTNTPPSTSTATRTASPSPSITATRTATETSTPLPTSTSSASPTRTSTFTAPPTATSSATATFTLVPSSTATASATRTNTPTRTATSPPSTSTATATRTSSATRTATRASTATNTPSFSPTPTATPVPAWSVSISTQVKVTAGGSVSVPVNIAAGSGITLFSFSLTYDASVVDVQSVQLASTAGLGMVDVTDVIPGTLSVAATLLQPMTVGGAVVNINFIAIGACSASTVLDITSCQLDNGAIGCTPSDGALQINCGVGGRIRHRTSSAPVAGATVAMMGTESSSTVTTNDLGQFGFGTMSSGNWQLVPHKVGDIDGAVTALDAALILQSVSGWRHLDPVQALICDTTGNGQVTPLDAVRILQFAVGQMNRLPVAAPCASDWAFIPDAPLRPNQELIQPQFTATTCQQGSILFAPLLGNAPQEDFIAVPFGDCTGNWSAAAQQAHLRLTRGDLRVRLGVARRRDGEWVLPLYLSSSQPFSALEARIVVAADSAPIDVRPTGVASDVMLRFGQQGTTLRLAMASGAPLNATGGPVALLTFDAASHSTGRTLAHLISAAVDEIDARIVD